MKISALPKRTLKVFTSVKHVDPDLVKLSSERSRYADVKVDAMPTAVVSNNMVRMYYGPDITYWEEPSELETIPWVSLKATEIESSKTPLNTFVQFKIRRYYGTGTKDSALEYPGRIEGKSDNYVPKDSAIPMAFKGWQSVGYKSEEIVPRFVYFRKEDCVAAKPLCELPKNTVVISTPISSDNDVSAELLKDSRFQLVDANNYTYKFAIIGKLSHSEWRSHNLHPKPRSSDPCSGDEVIKAGGLSGVLIPKSLEGKIEPEWYSDGFRISCETALALPFSELLTPKPWANNITVTRRIGQEVRVALKDLIGSDIKIENVVWAESYIYFSLNSIVCWPTNPLVCQFHEEDGYLSHTPPDPLKWSRVNKGTSPEEMVFIYPHAGTRGYRKVSVVDQEGKQKVASKREELLEQYGPNFETQFEELIGKFPTISDPQRIEKYVIALEYVAKNNVCLAPVILDNSVPKCIQGFNFSKTEDVYRKLRAIKPSRGYRELQTTLVYLYFRSEGVNRIQEEIFNQLATACPESAKAIAKAEKKSFKKMLEML